MGGDEAPGVKHGLTGAAIAAVAVACCAALPLLVALAGGVAIGTLLGIGAGALALGGAVMLIAARGRGRKS